MAACSPSLRPAGIRAGYAVLIWLVASLGCRQSATMQPLPAASPSPWFEDVTERSGLGFVHDPGRTDQYFMPDTMGGGATLFDYDQDGRLDVYLVQSGGPASGYRNALFHNDGDWQFSDASAGSGLDLAGFGMGAAAGDVNNDGLPDLLLTEYRNVRLFLNRGSGHFDDRTVAAGLVDDQWAVSAALLDYDRDGWLDIVVVNYLDYVESKTCTDPSGQRDYCGPQVFTPTVTRLFHNLGSGEARLEDVTTRCGIGDLSGPGLGVFCADFDGDGWPDIFVTNDGKPNTLWINRQDGTFVDEGVTRGIAYNSMGIAQANMGIAIGDLRGTGLLDVYVTHLGEEGNTLWVQEPRGMFSDKTAAHGLATPSWPGTGFGTVAADFNHDGAPDLAVVNGRVRRSLYGVVTPGSEMLGPHWSAYGERNQLFANDGTGKFVDISSQNDAVCAAPNVGRGLACGDLDGDGAIDLVVTTCGGPARLYRNVAAFGRHWLLVRAVDPTAGGRDAYGAEVRLDAGGRRRVGWVSPGFSYACSNDPRVHFGLDAIDNAEGIEVLWPDGSVEYFPGGEVDRKITLRKGEGESTAGPTADNS